MAETRKVFEKYFQKLFNNNIFKTSKEDQEIYKNNETKNSSLIEKINLRTGNIISYSLVVGGSFHFRVKSI